MNVKINQLYNELNSIQIEYNSSLSEKNVSEILFWSVQWQNKKNEIDHEVWNEVCKMANKTNASNVTSITIGSLTFNKPTNII